MSNLFDFSKLTPNQRFECFYHMVSEGLLGAEALDLVIARTEDDVLYELVARAPKTSPKTLLKIFQEKGSRESIQNALIWNPHIPFEMIPELLIAFPDSASLQNALAYDRGHSLRMYPEYNLRVLQFIVQNYQYMPILADPSLQKQTVKQIGDIVKSEERSAPGYSIIDQFDLPSRRPLTPEQVQRARRR